MENVTNFFYIILAIFLILLNAFFVAAEFGMVKLRHTQVAMLSKVYGVRGHILSQIHKQLDAYLSACQLGITLASLGLGWIGEPAFAYFLEPLFKLLNITQVEWIRIISFSTAFTLLSFLHIVIGELMPKSLAIRQPEAISLWTAIPLYGFYWLMYPAIWILNLFSNLMLKMTKFGRRRSLESFYSTDEIKLILNASHIHGELTEEEAQIIEHTLDFADLEVTEIMRPKDEMVTLDMDDPISTSLQVICDKRFSRYPVYQGNLKNILGIVHVKDLFKALVERNEIIDLRPFLRPVLKISDRLPALNLLKNFRKGASHFAIIYREKDTPIGFITLDNLLHVLLGRIQDEFHRTKVDWIKNPEGTFTIKGDCSIYSLEVAMDQDIELEEDEEEIITMAGLIMHRLNAFPKVEERIDFKNFEAVIKGITGSKIDTILIIPK